MSRRKRLSRGLVLTASVLVLFAGIASAAYVAPVDDPISSTNLPGTGTGANLTADDQENSGLIGPQESSNSGSFVDGSRIHYFDWYFTIGDQWKTSQIGTVAKAGADGYVDCYTVSTGPGTPNATSNTCIQQHRARIYGYKIDRATHKILDTRYWTPSDLSWASDQYSLDPNDWEAITHGPSRTMTISGSTFTRHTLIISAMGDGNADPGRVGPGSTDCKNRRLIEIPEPDVTSSTTTYTPYRLYDIDSDYTSLMSSDTLCNTESAWLGTNGKIHFLTKGNGTTVGNYLFQRDISDTAPHRDYNSTTNNWGTPSASTNELEDHAGNPVSGTQTPIPSYNSATRCWSTASPPSLVDCSTSGANAAPYVITDAAFEPTLGDLIAVNVYGGCTILRWTGNVDPVTTPPADIFHPGCGSSEPGSPHTGGELEGVSFVNYDVIPCTYVAGCGGDTGNPVPTPQTYIQRRIEGVFDMNADVPFVFHEEFTWQ